MVFGLLPATATPAPLAAELPSWIDRQGGVADAPFLAPTDAAFGTSGVWAVGVVERRVGRGFAVAYWQRDPASGRLDFRQSFTREDLGLDSLSQVFSIALSPDERFLYLGGRSFAFEAKIVVLAIGAAGELELKQVLGGLPDSGNEGELLLAPGGQHLYYGSRGITLCDRDAATGLLTRRSSFSSAAVVDLFFDPTRGQLFSTGEEVLHAWQRDPASGALTSLGIFDEVALPAGAGEVRPFSSGRRLARSPDGRFLYTVAFGLDLDRDPWGLLVFELQPGLPLLSGLGQAGFTGEVFPSDIAVHPASGAVLLAFSSLPGGMPSLASYPARDGGRAFDEASQRAGFAGHPDREDLISAVRFAGDSDLYAGGFDGGVWQRFVWNEAELTPAPTFDGVERLNQPTDLAIGQDGETLLVAAPAAVAVARLSYRQGELAFTASARSSASRILLLPDGRHGVLLEPGGGALQLFRLEEGEIVSLGSTQVDEVRELAASPDGQLIYALGAAVFSFDAASEKLLPYATLPTGSQHPPRISPDGRFLLLNQNYSSMFPYYLSTFLEHDKATRSYRVYDDPGTVQDELIDLAFAPDGDFVYVYKGSRDPRIAVYPRDPTSGAIGDLLQEERSAPGQPASYYFHGQLELDPAGRFLYNLREDDASLVVYERDPRDGRVRLLESFSTADGSAAKIGGLDSGSPTFLRVSATGNEVFLVDSARGKIHLLRHHCRPDDERSLCLGSQGRFRAEMAVELPAQKPLAARRIEAAPGDSGLFRFFSSDNWESLVKVLDGCAQNGYFWVYAAKASDLATTLKVTDTWTGESRQWHEPAGSARPAITDGYALASCAVQSPPAGLAAAAVAPGPPASAGAGELSLGGGRFTAKVQWSTASGQAGEAQVVPFASVDAGLFSFFHPDNWEVLVKVLDGCALNGHFWVYAAATTDLGLRLEVKDTSTGRVRVYTNPVGQPARSIADGVAFACP